MRQNKGVADCEQKTRHSSSCLQSDFNTKGFSLDELRNTYWKFPIQCLICIGFRFYLISNSQRQQEMYNWSQGELKSYGLLCLKGAVPLLLHRIEVWERSMGWSEASGKRPMSIKAERKHYKKLNRCIIYEIKQMQLACRLFHKDFH